MCIRRNNRIPTISEIKQIEVNSEKHKIRFRSELRGPTFIILFEITYLLVDAVFYCELILTFQLCGRYRNTFGVCPVDAQNYLQTSSIFNYPLNIDHFQSESIPFLMEFSMVENGILFYLHFFDAIRHRNY